VFLLVFKVLRIARESGSLLQVSAVFLTYTYPLREPVETFDVSLNWVDQR